MGRASEGCARREAEQGDQCRGDLGLTSKVEVPRQLGLPSHLVWKLPDLQNVRNHRTHWAHRALSMCAYPAKHPSEHQSGHQCVPTQLSKQASRQVSTKVDTKGRTCMSLSCAPFPYRPRSRPWIMPPRYPSLGSHPMPRMRLRRRWPRCCPSWESSMPSTRACLGL